MQQCTYKKLIIKSHEPKLIFAINQREIYKYIIVFVLSVIWLASSFKFVLTVLFAILYFIFHKLSRIQIENHWYIQTYMYTYIYTSTCPNVWLILQETKMGFKEHWIKWQKEKPIKKPTFIIYKIALFQRARYR